MPLLKGNCYVASEAVYHLTGSDLGPWRPEVMRLPEHLGGGTHWFLRNRNTNTILDVTIIQFGAQGMAVMELYNTARGCGFLTKKPSKRARALMERMIWATD